jgi:hypothetical protein
MTYASLQLRDNELLDVMLEARKNLVTTVSVTTSGRAARAASSPTSLQILFSLPFLPFAQMIHAENGDLIDWLTEKLVERGMTGQHCLRNPKSLSEVRVPDPSLAVIHIPSSPELSRRSLLPHPSSHTHLRRRGNLKSHRPLRARSKSRPLRSCLSWVCSRSHSQSSDS